MRCIDFRELISAELDGELEPREAAALEAHLAQCATCRQVREDFSVNRLLLHAMAPVEAPADSWSRVLQVVRAPEDETDSAHGEGRVVPLVHRESPRDGSAPAHGRHRWVAALKVAACLGVAFVGFLYWLGSTEVESSDLAPQAPRVSSTVPARSLMRGHVWLQVDNPMADRSAWHYYMAAEGDDERRTRPGHSEYQSAEGEVR